MSTESGTSAPHAPVQTMPEALARAIRVNPEGGAVYFGRRYTFAELDALTEAYAAGLASRGLGHGDRLVLQLQNSLPFVLSAMAVWRLGAVMVPVSPMYGLGEVRKIARDSGATFWVTAATTYAAIGEELLADTDIETVITSNVEDLAEELPEIFAGDTAEIRAETIGLTALIDQHRGERAPETAVHPEDIAILTYTSGTTGAPKGAMTTHQGVTWVGAAYFASLEVGLDDAVCLALAPFAHITGLAMHFASWLVTASTIVLGYRFNPDYYLDLVERYRVTWSTGAATAFIALIQAQRAKPRDLGSLQRFGCGGAPIPPRLIGEIRDVLGVGVQPGYGLTESTGGITTTPGSRDALIDPETGAVSVGLVMGDAEVTIRDEHGAQLPTGEPGEVCLRGGGVTTGYWGNPEATAEAIRDGWFYTGDSGYVNEDGWLFIVDRTKNMIIASGYKVWPREVEDVVYKLPAVREAAVIGVPDEYRGETVKAFVSLQPGQSIDTDEVIAHCRANLAAYKVPRLVEIVDEIPKNPNGKILHRTLRDREVAKASASAQLGSVAGEEKKAEDRK